MSLFDIFQWWGARRASQVLTERRYPECSSASLDSILFAIMKDVDSHGGAVFTLKRQGRAISYQFSVLNDSEQAVQCWEGEVREVVASRFWARLAELSTLPPAEVNLQSGRMHLCKVEQTNCGDFWVKLLPPLPHKKESVNELEAREEQATGTVRHRSPSRGIMLIDDDPHFSSIVGALISRQYGVMGSGFEVEHCHSAESAWQILRSRDYLPQLIICDLYFNSHAHSQGKNRDGISFVQELRNQEYFRSVPVILLTSEERDDVVLMGISAGADVFLGKSRDPRLLLAYVDRLVRRGSGTGQPIEEVTLGAAGTNNTPSGSTAAQQGACHDS